MLRDDIGIPGAVSHAWRRRLSCMAVLAALLGAAGPALAQGARPHETVRPGIGHDDPRSTMDRHIAPWRSLGRVESQAGRFCTGALVGPRLVLTAAHCLVSADGRAMVPAGALRFRLGYHQGSSVADARVASYVFGAAYRPGPVEAIPVSADWAMLTLDTAIASGDRTLTVLRGTVSARTPLMLGGYQRDNPERIQADTNCRALGQENRGGDTILVHDCASTFGASGGPLLAQVSGGGWAVVGVASRVARDLALGHAVPAGAVGAVGAR